MSRIIAGSHGGRRLAVPAGSATRPTTDRVREALFSAVVSWAGRAAVAPDEALTGLAFADLFAGAGAVGLEAASRGAAPVLLVESRGRAADLAARNVADLHLQSRVVLRTGRVEQVLPTPPTSPYDVVFLDPPYELATERVEELLGQLVAAWLQPSALVVAERSARTRAPSWPEGFEVWSRRYGETELHFGAR